MSLSTFADACSSMSSNIAQKDLVGHKGQYPIYGASGLIGFVNFYKQEQQYIAVVKDGAGIGRVFSLPPYSSVIGTMQYLLPKDSIDVNYLYYAVQFMHLEKYYTGSTIPHIYFKDYKHEPLNIPSRDKQQEISSILILVDKAIDTLHAQIAHLEELVKSRFVEMFGDPVTNPKGWEIAPLSDMGDCKNGMNFHKGENGVELHCLGVGDFQNLSIIDDTSTLPIVSLNDKPSKEYLLQNEDIVFVRSNGNKNLVGRCLAVYPNEIPTVFSGFCIRFRLADKERLTISYLLQVLKHESMRHRMTGRGANIQNLNQQILSGLYVPLPPLDLQNEFAAFVEQADKSKFAVLMHRQISLKTALLSAMFSSYTNSDRRICKSLHRRSVEHDEL